MTFDEVTSSEKVKIGRILRNFRLRMRTPSGTPQGSRELRSLVISGQKAPLGRILGNFRLCMRTHKGTTKGSRDLRSFSVAIVLELLYYIVYYYYCRSTQCTGCACAAHTSSYDVTSVNIISGHVTEVTSGHVTEVTSGQGRSLDFQ